jgi:hypothetical protein
MVNLGVATNTASASDLLNRNALEDNTVRPTLIVREEGKSATQFVSIFFSISRPFCRPAVYPWCAIFMHRCGSTFLRLGPVAIFSVC